MQPFRIRFIDTLLLFLKQNIFFMKFKHSLFIVFFIGLKTFSQENQNILFTIDNERFYSEEFLNVYKKNMSLVADFKADIESYLKLFIDYKLKVKEAKLLGLDSVVKFKNELKQYKNNLLLPYLKDKDITNKLIKEAYDRLKKEVNVSHILIFLKPDASPKDTLTAYNTLIEARNLVINGSDFEDVAKKYSKDPTVEQNGGGVGYFTALQMVYPFENVAFSTQVNKVSLPFRTKFGYHILKVNDIRASKGEIEVAHIMFKNESVTAKKQIDSIYDLLINKEANFTDLANEVSEDITSAVKGGMLKKFGTGQMIEDFENVAFSIKSEGDISKPFKTQLGWHIIKLIKKYPIENFENLEVKLTQEIENDERSNLVSKSVIDKLFKQYKVVVNDQALQQFNMENWRSNSKNFKQEILTINDNVIFQEKFITFLKEVNNAHVDDAFIAFKEKEVLNYYKDNIEHSNLEFVKAAKEFEEGLLLFDLMEKQVWDKAKDSIGLLNYFNKNKKLKYKAKDLKRIRGTVISDYQNYLETIFVKQLREKYDVKINKLEKKRIKKINS